MGKTLEFGSVCDSFRGKYNKMAYFMSAANQIRLSIINGWHKVQYQFSYSFLWAEPRASAVYYKEGRDLWLGLPQVLRGPCARAIKQISSPSGVHIKLVCGSQGCGTECGLQSATEPLPSEVCHLQGATIYGTCYLFGNLIFTWENKAGHQRCLGPLTSWKVAKGGEENAFYFFVDKLIGGGK